MRAMQLVDATTVSLSAILVLLVGVFAYQLRDVYQEWIATYESTEKVSHDYRGISRLEQSSDTPFFVHRNEPFVCRSCLDRQALEFWKHDDDILHVLGHDTYLPVRISQRSRESTATLFQRTSSATPGGASAYTEQNISITDFLKKYNDPANHHHLYAAQVNVLSAMEALVPRIQDLLPPIPVIEALGKAVAMSHRPLSLYWGAGPLVTQTHYDSMENFVCVLAGRKMFRLYDPATASKFLYIDRSLHGNGSPVTTASLNRTGEQHDNNPEFPLSRFALPSTVLLGSGDCLYLPVYWYHSVSTLEGRAISLNYWRKPNHEKMQLLEQIFCGHDNHLGARAKC